MTSEEKLNCLTDRPCAVCKYHKENGCSKWACVFEQEPTTKNDLGVDAVSRADALALYCDKCGIYNCISKCSSYRAVEKMPSATPIRPKGHWIEEFNDLEGEVRFTCSSCGKYQLFGTDFCYHCGSDNREVEE